VGEAEYRDEAKSTGYTADTGVIVSRVMNGAPAAGKLQPGDVITQMNGKQVESRTQLRNEIAMVQPGSEVKFTVWREGKTTDVTVKVGEQPADLLARVTPGQQLPQNDGTASAENLGVTLANLNDDLLERFGLSNTNTQGAIVTDVRAGSPAAQAGIRAGDVITRIGNTKINNAQAAADTLTKHDLSKGVRLYVTSKDGERFVFVKVTK
jgi:serine protease Do